MKYKIHIIGLLQLAMAMGNLQAQQPVSLISKVDPFIGVYGGGNMHPAATLPYSSVSLGPDVAYVQSPSGYGYTPNKPIIGFSHARTSGTGGGGRYGSFGVMPQVGKVNLADRATGVMVKNDFASPGYYTCDFASSNINVALTLSDHVGFHQYRFKQGDTATVLIDLASVRLTKEKSVCTEAHVEIVSNKVVKGWGIYAGGWGNDHPYKVYFYAEFENAAFEKGTWKDSAISSEILQASSNAKKDLSLGAYFKFLPTKNNLQVKFKLAMSYSSIDNAKKYFNEIADWNFDACKKAAENKWEKFLNRIKVEGGTADQQKIFYTAFYRQAMIPRDLTGDNPLWQSKEPHYWDFYTFWDTYRTANPLLTIIDPKRAASIIRCLLDVYQHRGWMPESWTGGDYGQTQGGSNPDVVVAEAIVKGIKGFDYELAYKALLADANNQSKDPLAAGRYVKVFEKYGYLPTENLNKRGNPPCGTSRTLECTYNDYCIALAAKKLGKPNDYKLFLKKSATVFDNLFHDSLKLFWMKNAAGQWLPPADVTVSNGVMLNGAWMGWNGGYYEGSPLSYSCSSVQDVARLIRLHGGKQPFISFLDNIFDGHHFEADNEPGMHLPYLYIYAGDTHKTYERLKEVFKTKYKTTRNGWPGNDDAGTTAAWFMWGNMGIYPMAGQDIYLLTTPVFSATHFTLEGNQTFSIEAKNLSETNSYIQSATLNGKPFNQAWIRHSAIAKGGKLVLIMGNQPSAWGTQNLPPSFDKVLAD